MKYGTMAYVKTKNRGTFFDNVLMIRKKIREGDPNSGFYTLPGGNLENDEKGTNPKGRLESAIRETIEETGIFLLKPVIRGTILFDNRGRTFPNWPNPDDFLVYLFSSHFNGGKLKRETEEGTPYWIRESLLPHLPASPGDVRMYEWLKDGRNFMGVIRHRENEVDEENTFVDYF